MKDREHLVRLALLFVVGFAVVLPASRALLVPDDFGELGHYRAGALADNMARDVRFAGQDACLECHGDVGRDKAAGAHAGVRCEACHGAQAAHAADPTVLPDLPHPPAVCLACHARSVARPQAFPQIEVSEHAGEGCAECHRSHQPQPA
ncbi:MAG: hypothetical protein KBD01_19760 [Acidobacteria bacterium]|nr:hypothetical protein [Acidobacteriota bacterium]